MNHTTALFVTAVCAVIIYLERSLPWLLFSRREMPPFMRRLADLLPAALMATLVIYGLKALPASDSHTAFAMVVASVFTGIIHYMKKNTILSVFLGTLLYVVLLNQWF